MIVFILCKLLNIMEKKNVLVKFCFLLNECSVLEPTPKIFSTGEAILPRYIRLLTTTNGRQFLFKISVLHKIIIIIKELKKFDIATNDHCNFCSRADYTTNTFLESDVSISTYSSNIKEFNDIHKLNVSPQDRSSYSIGLMK